jgi:hypothetical protein
MHLYQDAQKQKTKFSSHPTENTTYITKTKQLMAFTEITTIYYSENNIKHTFTIPA